MNIIAELSLPRGRRLSQHYMALPCGANNCSAEPRQIQGCRPSTLFGVVLAHFPPPLALQFLARKGSPSLMQCARTDQCEYVMSSTCGGSGFAEETRSRSSFSSIPSRSLSQSDLLIIQTCLMRSINQIMLSAALSSIIAWGCPVHREVNVL
jgi:hypothetical protein